ncbi:uncharacterized protein LOC128380656 [Scomber japonicus]|uniref:uncharacterized protein LOC128380656 n=1 Tax=Scomber japonicus TaxID=13676 RepID=UPI002305D877|nr:uncharacterized protein LOC128380656 [Scomber japonicus]
MQQVRVKYLRKEELHCSLTETSRPLRLTEKECETEAESTMSTDFTQDSVLHFLQSRGGTVKNSDLLLHFRPFLRDHAEPIRNRDLFKKFVNSVATVKQEEGVNYVILRKKFRGHVPGGGGVVSSGQARLPAGKNAEPSPEKSNPKSAVSRANPRQKAHLREETTPAPLGRTAKPILPAAGLVLNNNNNNVETNLNLKQQQQLISTPELFAGPASDQLVGHTQIPERTELKTPSLPETSAQDQLVKVGQNNKVRFGPPAFRHHGTTSQQVPGPETLQERQASLQPKGGLHQDPVPDANQQVPGPETLKGREASLQPKGGLHQDPVLHASQQVPGPETLQERQASLQPKGGLHQDPVPDANQQVPGPETLKGREASLQPKGGLHQDPVLHASQQVPGPETLKGREASLQLKGGLHRDPVPHASQQVPGQETVKRREASLQPQGGLHQDPSPHTLVAPRRTRFRQSYKTAVSYDDDEEQEEEVPMRQGSAWPLGAPLGHSQRVISASSPCIIDQPAPPSVISSSSSSERNPPKIIIRGVGGETLPPRGGWSGQSGAELRGQWAGPEAASVPGDMMSTRRSLPLEAQRYIPSPDRAEEVPQDHHPDHQYSHSADVQLEARQGSSQDQKSWLTSSCSSVFSPSSDGGFRSDCPPSDSPRGSGWNSSSEDLEPRAGETEGKVQEVLQRAKATKLESVTHRAESKTTKPWHHSTGNLLNDQEPSARVSPLHHSTDHLHVNQHSTPKVLLWHGSTGDLDDAESSDGSASSPPVRKRPAVARRLSSKLRSRMCRSLGANLDQLLDEETRGAGGNEAARLNRLHLISSSLSLHCNLSSSSLSSCSTPPRCQSLADLEEGEEGKGGRSRQINKQSLVPLEHREHMWVVKGAAGAWPDIYSLFREDSSLLNKRDFISGFTVLHWIAKHGDHRVLNTLWYGVEKAGLTMDINARSSCGHTPLHISAIHGHKNIMRLLVKKFSADVKLRDTAGKKPWQYLSHTMSPDIFQLLGAPARASLGEGAGARKADHSLEPQQHRRRHRRHHFSSASGDRPLTIAGTAKVKRSTSIAALLKHKSLRRIHGHLSESSI